MTIGGVYIDISEVHKDVAFYEIIFSHALPLKCHIKSENDTCTE